MSFVYKVCSIEEWNKASKKGIYEGSQVDLEDGFIHLSTKKQLKETVSKHFFGQKKPHLPNPGPQTMDIP